MKQTKKEVIPIHQMDAQIPLGIGFDYLDMANKYDGIMLKSESHIAHRDDYYMFLFMESVNAFLTIDFEEVQLEEQSVFYVRPGQVHFASSFREIKGWALAIDSMLVGNNYKNVFEKTFLTQRAIVLDTLTLNRISDTVRLLDATMKAEPTAFSNGMILNLANVFIGIIAEQYADRQEKLPQNKSRSALIAYQFKELLSENYKTTKSPIQYAQKLNYSLSHLNESVKEITGFPVSYWIHQQIVLEAKRLLCHTDMDVKEIAFSLGYEDYTYFSRLFSKNVKVSPNAFRRKFHE
ncbi:helix-turn-helix domain-containing protein [Anaerosporobacter sp.]|uniref:helix-turn-helix domain-containing protein n=1 Tax=Anaerosporobacter sp. TaxID=1872529 RepID=UPI00286ED122|nr:helix-turn-helix domain-containing protein [Anaerosporobacter sp.]